MKTLFETMQTWVEVEIEVLMNFQKICQYFPNNLKKLWIFNKNFKKIVNIF